VAQVSAHLVLQIGDGLAGPIPTAADIAEQSVRDRAAIETLGKHDMQRLAFDLGDNIPYGDLDGADADRALAMAARLLPLQHAAQDLRRIEVAAAVIEQR